MNKNLLSVVISVYNEEKNIGACLESVKKLADEIIVVNNSSTDDTEKIARKYTKYVYTQKNDPQKIDIQKNFGFSKATGEWILSLDADERISQELSEEIKEVVTKENEIIAYWIPRKNIIFGKWIQHTGWYPDEQLRLFRKNKAKYTSVHVHEHIFVEGETRHLLQPLIHEHYKTITEFVSKMMIYTDNEATNLFKSGYIFSYLDAIRFPSREFLSRFFARQGYKDGLHGLVLSLLMAFYHLVIFIFLWEKTGYKQVTSEHFLHDVKNESYSLIKEFSYWFTHETLKTSSTVKKIAVKLREKFNL